MRTLGSIEELHSCVGEELGTSDWLSIDQDRVDAFAGCTLDKQWVHVDPLRSEHGPFGGTIAHGFLSLALIPYLGSQIFRVEVPGPSLNYGVNKVRFPAPLPVGSRVRARATISEVLDTPAGTQVKCQYTIEAERIAKPVCVAETVALLVGE